VKGNVAAAARLAGKDRKDFYDLMKRHHVDPGRLSFLRAFRGR